MDNFDEESKNQINKSISNNVDKQSSDELQKIIQQNSSKRNVVSQTTSVKKTNESPIKEKSNNKPSILENKVLDNKMKENTNKKIDEKSKNQNISPDIRNNKEKFNKINEKEGQKGSNREKNLIDNNIPFVNNKQKLNNSDKSTPNKLKNLANKNQNFPQSIVSSVNQNEEENSITDEVKKKVGGAAVSAATGGAISGEAAEFVADVAVKKQSKMLKFYAIGFGVFAFFLFLIILVVIGGNAENAEVGSSTNPYVTGQIEESDLIDQLVYYGYCKEERDCKSKGVYKFFEKLKDVYEEYGEYCTDNVKNNKPCGVNINTALIIETINYYQKYGESFSDFETEDTDEEKLSISSIFSAIANFFRKNKKLGDMKNDIEALALAQSEFVKANCDGETSYYYQISFNKYISYLKYGESSTHPNYNGKPVEVDSCEGPKNDYIAGSYSVNTAGGNSSSTPNVDENGKIKSISGEGQGVEIVNYALQFVGNPYVWGGTSLTNGADCSGFTMSVFNHFGITLPHNAKSQFSAPGVTVISRNISDVSTKALPGDLIVWSGHVAIYIGNGQIVHAQSSKTGIVVSKVSSNHSFLGIVRYWK